MKVLITGGEQKKHTMGKPEWTHYKRAKMVVVDLETDEVEDQFCYETPPEARPEEDSSIVFKAGSLVGNELLVCTQTEVLIFNYADGFHQTGYVSLPLFNDLHHVQARTNGNLLVVSTGLDAVLEVTREGDVIEMQNVLGRDPWERFSPDVDYRRVLTTKPHQAHPNYVFETDNEHVWATRFEQRDAICLTDPARRIPIDIERPHDGVVYCGEVHFTTIDGHLVSADWRSQQVTRVVNLNEVSNHKKVLGWCRGLAFVDDDRAIIGFSRIRPTRYQKNINWVRTRIGQANIQETMPTRLVIYNFRTNALEKEIELEEMGINAVFSILPLPTV